VEGEGGGGKSDERDGNGGEALGMGRSGAWEDGEAGITVDARLALEMLLGTSEVERVRRAERPVGLRQERVRPRVVRLALRPVVV